MPSKALYGSSEKKIKIMSKYPLQALNTYNTYENLREAILAHQRTLFSKLKISAEEENEVADYTASLRGVIKTAFQLIYNLSQDVERLEEAERTEKTGFSLEEKRVLDDRIANLEGLYKTQLLAIKTPASIN